MIFCYPLLRKVSPLLRTHLYLIPYVALLGVGVTTFCLSFYVPVYFDEVAFPVETSRLGYDGWRIADVWPLCPGMMDMPIPWSLLPGRILAWLVYYPISTPMVTRLAGMAIFAMWVFLLSLWMKKSIAQQASWIEIVSLVASLSYLGLMPFMVMLFRPETMMAIAVSFYALLPFYVHKRVLGSRAYTVLILIFLLVSSWFFSIHQKAIVFAPLALYALWFLRRKGWRWWASLGLMGCILFQSVEFTFDRLICWNDPASTKYFTDHTILPSTLLDDPQQLMNKAKFGLYNDYNNYTNNLYFHPNYAASWLPAHRMDTLQEDANEILDMALMGIGWFWVLSIAIAAISAYRRRSARSLLAPSFIVPLVMLACGILLSIAQQYKSFYDTVLPGLGSVCLTVILLYATPCYTRRIRMVFFAGIGMASLMTQLALQDTFAKLPVVDVVNASVNGDLGRQGASVSILTYAQQREHLLGLAKRCNIDPQAPNAYLVLDMFTYFSFKGSYRPVMVSSVQNQIAEFASRYHSSGLVTLCKQLPGDIRSQSQEQDGLCCLSAEALLRH